MNPVIPGDTALLADIVLAFNLGVVSTLHCIGMCGGIIAALTLGLAPSGRRDGRRLVGFALAYNGGRVVSYVLAGVVAGLLGQGLATVLSEYNGHRVLRAVAGLVLVLAGLSLAGWLPRGASVERLGAGLWRHLQPLGQRLLPVTTLPRALAFGLVWGWLPCALVYSTLMFAAASARPERAAAIMLAFGLGTLPTLVWATWLAARAPRPAATPGLRYAAAVILVAAGCLYPFMSDLLPAAHHHH